MKIDMTFIAKITKDKNSGWTCVEWPESVSALGTGKAVKVTAAIDGHDFQATFLTDCHKRYLLSPECYPSAVQ